jgi:hypothetical protein
VILLIVASALHLGLGRGGMAGDEDSVGGGTSATDSQLSYPSTGLTHPDTYSPTLSELTIHITILSALSLFLQT